MPNHSTIAFDRGLLPVCQGKPELQHNSNPVTMHLDGKVVWGSGKAVRFRCRVCGRTTSLDKNGKVHKINMEVIR
jgi:hypothetical protein